jgi:hypothetical protein
MKYGNCDGCGRKGVTGWYFDEEKKGMLKGKFILVNFGGGYHCCDDKCYEKARGLK